MELLGPLGNMISFDRPKLERLRKAVCEAEKEGLDAIAFEGSEYLVSYAKHLIVYVGGYLAGKGRED